SKFGEDAKDGPNSLRGGFVGPQFDGSENAGPGGAGAARRAGQVRRQRRLEGPRDKDQPVEGLGRAARRSGGRYRLSRLAEGGRAVEERRRRDGRVYQRFDGNATRVGS